MNRSSISDCHSGDPGSNPGLGACTSIRTAFPFKDSVAVASLTGDSGAPLFHLFMPTCWLHAHRASALFAPRRIRDFGIMGEVSNKTRPEEPSRAS